METKNNEQNNELTPGKIKRLKNLKPIKPGERRNPKGRPKGALDYKTRVSMAVDVLALKFVADYNSKHKKQIKMEDVDIYGDIFQQAINKARNGDMKAIIDFFDRLYGKAKQPVELTGKDGSAVEYEVLLTDARKRAREMLNRWHPKPEEPKK